MRKTIMAALLLAAAVLPARPARAAEGLDTALIERLTGLKGTLNERENAYKVVLPRTDMEASVAGAQTAPPMGLATWAAFTPCEDHFMVMGDLVLLEDQVNPVMSAALDNGLLVTALHNHFMWDTPRIMFMHVAGMGPQRKLAAAVGAVFERIKATAGGKGVVPWSETDPAFTTLDPRKLDAVFGAKGDLAQGVYKISFGKKTRMHGTEVDGGMGVATWAAFAGSDDSAVVDGDFAMYEEELQPVLRSLRASGIYVVAIHNHMTTETPRVMFLHFWGTGKASELARALKAARATQKN